MKTIREVELEEKVRKLEKLKDYLIDRNDEKEERINKALKWINENKYYFPSPNELINILKGE